MTQPDDYETLFDEQRPLIEKLLAAIASRYGLRGDDAEEYASLARMRLWEDGYAVLRKWRRESKLSTYLAVVLTNLAHEFRIRRDGRWRPSAAALRLGPPAVVLEKLVHHYGMRLEEAGEWLRTRGETTLADRELGALLARLPMRAPRARAADAEPAADQLPADARADDAVLAAEGAAEWRATLEALDGAVGRLPAEEQVVVRMHFLEGRTLADVARALGVEQKPLYRVKDGALRKLRGLLEEGGMTRDRLHGLLDGAAPPLDDAPGKSPGARPSNEAWSSNLSVETRAGADAGRFRAGERDG